ncbi:MAG: rhombosortase [Pseudomonadota bacterium]
MGFATGNKTARDWALRHRIVIAALVLALLSLVLELAGSGATEALRYQRDAVAGGELWRLFSANVVHLGLAHWAMNALALVLIAALFAGSVSLPRWLAGGLGSGLAVTLGLHAFNPALHWYVGLSGLLHGLLAVGLVATLANRRRPDWLILAAGLIVKLGWEQAGGALPGSTALAGGEVIVDAHLYGAFGGTAAALLARGWEHARRSV